MEFRAVKRRKRRAPSRFVRARSEHRVNRPPGCLRYTLAPERAAVMKARIFA